MEITEVFIKLMTPRDQKSLDEKLLGFGSITIDDCFVVRDLKIIEGVNGPFVAMPSRKLTAHCPLCRAKNHLGARFCNQCGHPLQPHSVVIKDREGRLKLYADIAHPINTACRDMIQRCVITEYRAEQERAKQPGYTSRYDQFFSENGRGHIPPTQSREPRPRRAPPSNNFGAGIL